MVGSLIFGFLLIKCCFILVDLTTSEMLVNMSSSTLEEYYPAIAIATLMRIIRDPTLSQHHTMVVQVISSDTEFVILCLPNYKMCFYFQNFEFVR
jgi:Domain of unknown function (DUF3385).